MKRPLSTLSALALLVTGCDGAATRSPSALALAPPAALLSTRAVDRTQLRPRVSIEDGRQLDMTELDTGRWSGTIDLAPGGRYTLRVTWIETIGGRQLELASFTRDFTVGDDGSLIEVDASEYDLTLDRDGDGISNLAERENGSDPFVAAPDGGDGGDGEDDEDDEDDGNGGNGGNGNGNNGNGNGGNGNNGNGNGGDEDEQPDDRAPDPASERDTARVIVPRIAREDAPRIDGLGVARDANGAYLGEWAAATRFDADGNPLAIDRFMVDGGTDETDGTIRRRWAAMHDGEYLYVLVVVDDEGLRFRDSMALFNDDSLELFIDGNNSKSRIPDRDDIQRTMPLVAPGTNRSGVDEGIVSGPFLSRAPVEIDFATGPGLGPPGQGSSDAAQDVYELRIELDSANIVPERPFGFELQVNDDDDGGRREGKWGWAHPARVSEDIDRTFINPSIMGVAVLD